MDQLERTDRARNGFSACSTRMERLAGLGLWLVIWKDGARENRLQGCVRTISLRRTRVDGIRRNLYDSQYAHRPVAMLTLMGQPAQSEVTSIVCTLVSDYPFSEV